MAISVKQYDRKLEEKILALMFEHEDNIDTILENGISINDFTLEVNRVIYDTIVYLYKNDETDW